MRIAVVGAGGVGGYFGGRMAQAGEEVTFIARGKQLQALQDGGLRVDSIKGDFVVAPVDATDDPSTVAVVDAVLVCVKAWQVTDAAESIRPIVGDGTAILPLQNGVEAASQLAAVHGEHHVLGGVCRIMSKIVAPGHIAHVGVEPFVALGELDGRKSERVAELVRAFEGAGAIVKNPDDIHVSIWKKFLLMAPFGGVGAATRAPAGGMRSVPETREMLELAMHEVWAVGRAMDISLPNDVVSRTMALIDGMPADGMSSMQRDILDGRPSELEAHNGAVVRLGRSVGVATPVNRWVYATLLPAEKAARG